MSQNATIHTISPQKMSLSLTLMDQGRTYIPISDTKRLPNDTLGFNWGGSAHSAHNTAAFCVWSDSNQEQTS